MNKILLITPTYNEASNIQKFIDSAEGIDEIDLLVVDDNSPDGTADIVTVNIKKNKKLYLISRAGKLGLGTAYLEGFEWFLNSNYDFCIQMDSDFSHSFEDLVKLLKFRRDADLVIGSRYVSGGSTKGWSTYRRLLSKYANILSKSILRSNINDLTGGFKILSRNVIAEILKSKPSSNGYTFQIEVNNLIERKKFKIIEVPITFVEREYGKTKMNYQIIIEAIKYLFKSNNK
ncbi:polyprenol monophosphomannose synthase [Candidatus Actinomarina sp.]|nr:polyprenol monophosphomannose synthase [Candidatus Actinomarina sp.]